MNFRCFYLFICAKNDKKDAGIAGRSSFEKENHNCILIFNTGLSSNLKENIVHEIGHSLGLKHPFDKSVDKRINKFNSHNFMDYSQERNSFWKWQINIIRANYE